MTRRMNIALIGGVLLGVLCIIGAYIRLGSTISTTFLFALWYNRVILGLVVGAPWPKVSKTKAMLRGAILGTLVSFAFYSATGFLDPVSFVAGLFYGVILEGWLSRSEKKEIFRVN